MGSVFAGRMILEATLLRSIIFEYIYIYIYIIMKHILT